MKTEEIDSLFQSAEGIKTMKHNSLAPQDLAAVERILTRAGFDANGNYLGKTTMEVKAYGHATGH